MKILVFGGDGMLGHRLIQDLNQTDEVAGTFRRDESSYQRPEFLDASQGFFGVDVRDLPRVLEVCEEFRPDAVINAAGIVKQRPASQEARPSIEVNALFPHRLALVSAALGARLIHISTDCVFSGSDGSYREDDPPDAVDLYGQTKLLGEVTQEHCLTLRTSIIGRELSRKTGLVEWFLAQEGTVRGFTRAMFSGVTTGELSRAISMILRHFPAASGLYHISSQPISKHDLLSMLRDELGLATTIIPDATVEIDRSLDSSRFQKAFGYTPPTWREMIQELATELTEKPT